MGHPLRVGELRVAYCARTPKTDMVRLLASFWHGSLEWWYTEELISGERREVLAYQFGNKVYSEMEAIAWCAK